MALLAATASLLAAALTVTSLLAATTSFLAAASSLLAATSSLLAASASLLARSASALLAATSLLAATGVCGRGGQQHNSSNEGQSETHLISSNKTGNEKIGMFGGVLPFVANYLRLLRCLKET